MRRHIDAIKAVSPTANSLEAFIPKKILLNFLKTKNDICSWVFTQYPDPPENFKLLYNLSFVLYNISKYRIRIEDITGFKREVNNKESYDTKELVKKAIEGKLEYNIFSSKTGRVYLKKGSFPLYNLKKEYRKYILPYNDLFIELDYNGAEIRTLLGLAGYNQPDIDIHQWNTENIFENKVSRAESKDYFFSWLYNSQSKILDPYRSKLSEIYKKDDIQERYWNGKEVKNTFGRKFESNSFKALNGICQSTAADLFSERVIQVYKFLEGRKSQIAFIMLDAVVVDFDTEDLDILPELKRIFQDTKLGKFKVNIGVGKNYGEMESK